jgi:hypothetical protein
MPNSPTVKEHIKEIQVVTSFRKLLLPQNLVDFRTTSRNENHKNMMRHGNRQNNTFLSVVMAVHLTLNCHLWSVINFLYTSTNTFIFLTSFLLS